MLINYIEHQSTSADRINPEFYQLKLDKDLTAVGSEVQGTVGALALRQSNRK